ncbi:hypothetical protein EO244_06160 [Ancylomarina salipaludis]|uniref:Uncharacterized protein n=1 Tax=Ancylomarina salipaludis TaxID=2501299 RepID=A0A4Q1JNY7_9BACT|nr:hypothetical protein [Ancylomarina salipaludis]RXQ95887.1 hypothetical protein EO244_06160 [Ancylomarina salipaludis]
MGTNLKLSEVETLELYRNALHNAEHQPKISAIMADLGFDSAVIGEGKAILAATRQAFDTNKIEDDETSAAFAEFSGIKTRLEALFNVHRKKAKVVFRKDALTADKLAISGVLPRTYIKWIEVVKKFYSEASGDTTIQSQLARLKITPEDLSAATALIADLEAARSHYLIEKGESQDATKAKDAAFYKIDDWMSEFFAVARIGLEDNPQLLEALGKIVRN